MKIADETITPIPPIIITRYVNIILNMDDIKVNKITCLVTYSRIVKFCTATEIGNQKILTLVNIIVITYAMYKGRGFIILAVAG